MIDDEMRMRMKIYCSMLVFSSTQGLPTPLVGHSCFSDYILEAKASARTSMLVSVEDHEVERTCLNVCADCGNFE